MTLLLNQVHLDDTARNLEKGTAAFPQRVYHDGNRRTEAPNNPDDDPCGKPTHAKDGTRKEEWERDQNEQNKSLNGIKSLELIDIRDAGGGERLRTRTTDDHAAKRKALRSEAGSRSGSGSRPSSFTAECVSAKP